ncbi:ASCH domain-containing protein [Pseudomonas citronellolis]|uniref:hypothetical protein n=1 Tax=Pseudomonas citronellolis TaxID=53408 RepID=UPI0021BE9ABE|nr:hypothetical protein [Pseudomonas citronellolis]UXJ54856.1 hypothetical protein N5P21_11855 [Pseudomonas citronellolis]
MKERPILFSGPMVRAILEGHKTVTRRPVRGGQIPKERHDEPDPAFRWSAVGQHDPRWGFLVTGATEAECAQELARAGRCPHGKPGDRLWVRETYADIGCRLTYRADVDDGAHCQVKKWTPAIHMFRKDSRILLEITAVRIERLQDISEEHARAEGITDGGCCNCGNSEPCGCETPAPSAVDSFVHLWNSTGGDWDANPWVWVVEFKRVAP